MTTLRRNFAGCRDTDPMGRFLAKVEKPNGDDGCWIWHGSKNNRGYGRFYPGRPARAMYAHRWIYEQTVGRIPLDRQIDHLCRVKHCVNPAHLEVVTAAENMHRADSPSIVASRTGRCQRGHELPTTPNYQGKRTCVICKRDSIRRRRLNSANRQRCPGYLKEVIWERCGGVCELCRLPMASIRQMNVHHRKLRSQGGDWSPLNLMGVHQRCHNVGTYSIHLNPARSYALGHLVRSGADPAEIPVQPWLPTAGESVPTCGVGAA